MPSPRPAPQDDRSARRVAVVHREAVQGLRLAGSLAVGAGFMAVLPHRTGTWLPLHLALGAGLVVVCAVTQLLAVTWSSGPAPSPRWAAGQRWPVAAGMVLVAVGREREASWVVAAGATTVGVGLGALAAILWWVRRRARTPRFHPAIDAYLGAVVFGLLGIALGATMAVPSTTFDVSRIRQAHVIVNVLGLLGLVVAGTVPYFSATQARMKMVRRATPSAIRATTAALAVGTAAAAVAALAGAGRAQAGALLVDAACVVALARLVVVPGRRQLAWAGPRLLQMAAGGAWWVVGLVMLAASVGWGAPTGDRALVAILLGGYAQIVVASLAYLLPVLRAGGHVALGRGFDVTRSWPSLVVANAAAVAAVAGATSLAVAFGVVWVLDGAVRVVRLARAPLVTEPAAATTARS